MNLISWESWKEHDLQKSLPKAIEAINSCWEERLASYSTNCLWALQRAQGFQLHEFLLMLGRVLGNIAAFQWLWLPYQPLTHNPVTSINELMICQLDFGLWLSLYCCFCISTKPALCCCFIQDCVSTVIGLLFWLFRLWPGGNSFPAGTGSITATK